MITKTYTISTANIPELVEVFGASYQATINDENGNPVANPQTKAQFASSVFDTEIMNYVKSRVFAHRKTQLMQQMSSTEIISVG